MNSVRPSRVRRAVRLEFESTQQDRLDAFESLRNRTGMRSWIRGAVVCLGFMWLAGVVVVVATSAAPGLLGDTAAAVGVQLRGIGDHGPVLVLGPRLMVGNGPTLSHVTFFRIGLCAIFGREVSPSAVR